jgi:hypothetical protein
VRRVKAQEVSYGGMCFDHMSSVITPLPRLKNLIFVFCFEKFYKNIFIFVFDPLPRWEKWMGEFVSSNHK